MSKVTSGLLITLVSCGLLLNNTARANAQVAEPIIRSAMRPLWSRLLVQGTSEISKHVPKHVIDIAKKTGFIDFVQKNINYAERNVDDVIKVFYSNRIKIGNFDPESNQENIRNGGELDNNLQNYPNSESENHFNDGFGFQTLQKNTFNGTSPNEEGLKTDKEKSNEIQEKVVWRKTTNAVVVGSGVVIVAGGGQTVYCNTTHRCGTPNHKNNLTDFTKDSVCNYGSDRRQKHNISQGNEAVTEKSTKNSSKFNKCE